MTEPRYYTPIEVRYGDLDPQGHLNNAKYLTYFEHARTQYIRHLGLFKEGQSFLEIGVILAEVRITFHKAVEWQDKIKVGVRTARLGNKSMTVEQCIVDQQSGEVYASGEVVLVAYDYRKGETIPIPDEWRRAIGEFEGLP